MKKPYGAIPGIGKAKECIFPWISVNQVKNELKQSDKLEVTTKYSSPSLVMQPSTATMSTLTPDQYEPSQPLLLCADGIVALPFPSNLIHNSYFVEEEVDANNESVSERYDSQLLTTEGTSPCETGGNGALTWESFEANTNETITNRTITTVGWTARRCNHCCLHEQQIPDAKCSE